MIHPGKTGFVYWLVSLMLVSVGLAFAQDGRVTAELSSPVMAFGETVNLQITAHNIDAELDITALEKDFEVVSRTSSRQVNIVNGQRSSTVTWNIGILPRRVGALVVPAVNVGGLSTQALRLQVTAAASGTERQVYLEASVDNPNPYVQSQLIYTLKIYQRVQFSGDSLGYPDAPGLTVQQLGNDKQYTEEVDGQQYAVFERRFALFPQSSGKLIIPPVTLQGSTPGQRSTNSGLFTPRTRFTRQSQPIELDVKPRPADFTGEWWLPATSLELTASWATATSEFVVGQPLTRIISLVADGVGESQLPLISAPEINGANIYADESEASTVFIPNGLQAQREFSWAIIPQQAGALELPEIKLPWFDVATGTTQMAVIPAETIQVSASSTNSTATVAAPVGTAASLAEPVAAITDQGLSQRAEFWQRLAIVLGAAWLLTTGLAWFAWQQRLPGGRQKPPEELKSVKKPRMAIHIAAVEAAVRDNDLAALSRAVNAWGSAALDLSAPSLGEIAKRVESSELGEQLWSLDAALYRSADHRPQAAEFQSLAGLLRAEKPHGITQKDATHANQYALPAL